ncbi:DUF2931 family protein [Serratia fonticola]
MACHGASQPEASVQNDVPTEWKFNFFTPQALPAVVTFAAILDAGGTDYRFNTLDSTKALYGVVGEWNDRARALNGHWNHVKHPPRHILFCWDSVIDKRSRQLGIRTTRYCYNDFARSQNPGMGASRIVNFLGVMYYAGNW